MGLPAGDGSPYGKGRRPCSDAIVLAVVLSNFYILAQVEQCYPNTKIYCWRTAPRVATDDRIHHFFHKRPHIMSALNQLARYTARKRGWCILDLDQMLQVLVHEPCNGINYVSCSCT